MICAISGRQNTKSPYLAAPIILILGLPSRVPLISCITYTLESKIFLLTVMYILLYNKSIERLKEEMGGGMAKRKNEKVYY